MNKTRNSSMLKSIDNNETKTIDNNTAVNFNKEKRNTCSNYYSINLQISEIYPQELLNKNYYLNVTLNDCEILDVVSDLFTLI